MQDFVEAIEGGASGEDIAALPIPDHYRGAHVLRIESGNGAPVLNPSPDATWGLHLLDANVAQGELVELVRAQSARYAAR